MAAPEPMLSTSARSWPAGSDWVMQPKWDGFRILVAVDTAGRPDPGAVAHGTSLIASLGDLLDPFTQVQPRSLFDGELVAVASREGHAVQDFGAVSRAVLTRDAAATPRLHLVAFDLLELAGQDLRQRPWVHRDAQLRDALPATDRVRLVPSRSALKAPSSSAPPRLDLPAGTTDDMAQIQSPSPRHRRPAIPAPRTRRQHLRGL